MSDKSLAHVIQTALQDAGFTVVVTGYSAEAMSLWVTDDNGNAFTVSATVHAPMFIRSVGSVLRGFVSEGAESSGGSQVDSFSDGR